MLQKIDNLTFIKEWEEKDPKGFAELHPINSDISHYSFLLTYEDKGFVNIMPYYDTNYIEIYVRPEYRNNSVATNMLSHLGDNLKYQTVFAVVHNYQLLVDKTFAKSGFIVEEATKNVKIYKKIVHSR